MIFVSILNIIGLILGFLGSIFLAKVLLLRKKEAADLGGAYLFADTEAENEKLPLAQLLIKQSKSVKIGIVLICFGFFFQLISAMILII